MRITFTNPSIPKSGTYVTLIGDGQLMSEPASSADLLLDNALTRGLTAFGVKGKKGEVIDIPTGKGAGFERFIAISVGNPQNFNVLDAQNLGGELYARLAGSGLKQATINCMAPSGASVEDEVIAAEIAYGMKLASYRFTKYQTSNSDDPITVLSSVNIQTKNAKEARQRFAAKNRVAEGVHIARDLLEEPPNVLYPESFADRCLQLRELGVEVQVLTDKNMAKLGMGALLGVAQGSAKPARLVIMRCRGRKGVKGPLALVGKGVTFDTGGISI
ncbi:MAG: M17 family peptidase N-terminal domain-containing protein, partial [Rhodospirillales bacterium]